MANIKQSAAIRRTPPTIPYTAGQVHEVLMTFVFTEAFVAATDIAEIGALPAGARVVSARLAAENLAAGETVTVGLMTGDYGSKDSARDSGSEFFNGVAGNAAESTLPLVTAAGIAPDSNRNRSIGVKIGANVAAGAAKKVHVSLSYAM